MHRFHRDCQIFHGENTTLSESLKKVILSDDHFFFFSGEKKTLISESKEVFLSESLYLHKIFCLNVKKWSFKNAIGLAFLNRRSSSACYTYFNSTYKK